MSWYQDKDERELEGLSNPHNTQKPPQFLPWSGTQQLKHTELKKRGSVLFYPNIWLTITKNNIKVKHKGQVVFPIDEKQLRKN